MLYALMVIIWFDTSHFSSACPSSIYSKSFLSQYVRWATQILKARTRAMLKLILLNFLPKDFIIETFILHKTEVNQTNFCFKLWKAGENWKQCFKNDFNFENTISLLSWGLVYIICKYIHYIINLNSCRLTKLVNYFFGCLILR